MTYRDNGYVPRVGYHQQFALGGVSVDPRWDNLVAGWHFDETSGSRVDVLGNITLAETGTVTSTTGVIGNAAVITSFTNTLDAEPPPAGYAEALSPYGGARTWCGWFYSTDFGGANDFFKVRETGLPIHLDVYAAASTGLFSWRTNDGSNQFGNYGGNVTSGQWNFWVFWIDASGNMYGQLNDSAPVQSGSMTLGTASQPSGTAVLRFEAAGNPGPGYIDETYVFSETKDASWRADMYNSGAGRAYPL